MLLIAAPIVMHAGQVPEVIPEVIIGEPGIGITFLLFLMLSMLVLVIIMTIIEIVLTKE
jgi:hypothetical protein